MDSIDLQAFSLYWLVIWGVLGSAITALIFDHKHRSPWQGAFLGLMIGVISGQLFGRLILEWFLPVFPDLATWASMLGGLALLIPFWLLIKPTDQPSLRHYGFVAGTITPLTFYLLLLGSVKI